MKALTTGYIAQWAGGIRRGVEVECHRVTTDSRDVQPGDLFIALRGEKFDGHAFAARALQAGAVAVMVEDGAGLDLEPSVVVRDTRQALGRLAAGWRGNLPVRVALITGSSGKTTVKEMLAAMLRAQAGEAAVLATRGNRNNEIGLPLTLLELRAGHSFAVLEAGMNHAGELAWLTEVAQPDLVLVNNAGSAHIGLLGSAEAVARAKGEIVGASPAGARVVLNADDRFFSLWRTMAGAREVCSFGFAAAADVRGIWDGQGLLQVSGLATGVETFNLALPGRHNAANALAALAAAAELGVALPAMRAGLASVRLPHGRLEFLPGRNGARLIDDSYNANPESVRAAIAVLAACSGKRILVFGDMGELGEQGAAAHRAVGEQAHAAGIDALYALGEASRASVEAFGIGGRHFASVEELAGDLAGQMDATTTVLVKGSRFMAMERVAALLGETN